MGNRCPLAGVVGGAGDRQNAVAGRLQGGRGSGRAGSHQPTSFTFDDQGRIWVTESVEYPRASPGVGQDRVKILESTNHDGHYDKATVFKDA